MRLQSIRVVSYKSILDTGQIILSKDMTVLVGRNNSGKSAILECMRFTNVQNEPFRGSLDSEPDEHTDIVVDVVFSGPEILKVLQQRKDSTNISIPIPASRKNESQAFFDEFMSAPEIIISARVFAGSRVVAAKYPSHSLAEEGSVISVTYKQNGESANIFGSRPDRGDHLVAYLTDYMHRNIFSLRAMRSIPAISKIQSNGDLDDDGSNLPACLFYMQGHHPRLFEKLTLHVVEIVPDITNITFIPVVGEQIGVKIWLQAHSPAGAEFSLDLHQCGTGVAQILSLLYLAMISGGKIIAIDEPNSFLHPGAAKRLMEILSEYKNQYIITTHSPEIISSAGNKSVFLVRKETGASHVSELSLSKVSNLKNILSELGVSFGDVFGAEDIVWVEGETEQLCFPKLLAFDGVRNQTTFIVVNSTGDFSKKGLSVESVVGIYERLTNAVALFPAQTKFSFDRETLSDAEISDVQKRSGGRIKILPRRTFENYLIHPMSIASALNAGIGTEVPQVSEEGVRAWIDQNIGNYAPKEARSDPQRIVCMADAAKLLYDLFNHFSQATLEYRKTTHSPLLLQSILDNDAEFLSELRSYSAALVAR